MGRAKQTAEPACRLLGLEPVVEEWTREIDGEGYTTHPDGVRKPLCAMSNLVARGLDEFDLPFSRSFESRAVAQLGMQARYESIQQHSNEIPRAARILCCVSCGMVAGD